VGQIRVSNSDATGNYSKLLSFPGGTDGGRPSAGVIRDSAGNLYGTTHGNGALCIDQPTRCGVVFELDSSGHETVLYRFKGGNDGAYPDQGVIRDAHGDLYGTTYAGATSNLGVVFRVSKSGKETVLYTFVLSPSGAQPWSGVVRDSSGNLYGTTFIGGVNTGPCATAGCGVVYKIAGR
jgi:uncharacterized repeat protein (TIGR03803 family)